MASVPTTWIKLWMIMAKLLLRASEMVSTSLVKWLMMSPVPAGSQSSRRGSVCMVGEEVPADVIEDLLGRLDHGLACSRRRASAPISVDGRR